MAKRPVYIPDPTGLSLVRSAYVDFQWQPGLAVAQKQRSIAALHAAARLELCIECILEVSSKSAERLGVALSAFNLTFAAPSLGKRLSVECAFQGSKIFTEGGPYTDLYAMGSRDAKRDQRLKQSGNLRRFRFDGLDWDIEPQTAFYDWLYISALKAQPELSQEVMNYQAFTDIEFNPEKSINCQAYAVALFQSLSRAGKLDEATSSQAAFLEIVRSRRIANARENSTIQGALF